MNLPSVVNLAILGGLSAFAIRSTSLDHDFRRITPIPATHSQGLMPEVTLLAKRNPPFAELIDETPADNFGPHNIGFSFSCR